MERLSERIKNMNYSKTLEISKKSRELKDKGFDIINLSIGESDFSPPNSILEYAKKAIDNGHHYYTPVSGCLELRKAVSEKFFRDNHLIYNTSQIVISNGCKQSIMNIFLAILNPGDEVIIPQPYWVSYYEMANLCGAKQVIISTKEENDFKISPEQLEKSITKRSKIFIFSSPCNPTGSIYSRKELYELSRVFSKNSNIIIISDEIYEYINYSKNYTSIAEFSEVYNQTVTLNGLSKSFSMTGWRIGYIGAPEWLAKACDKIQGQTTSCPNSIAQQAAIIALKISSKSISYMIKEFKERRNFVLKEIKKIPYFYSNIPKGTFYIFPNISSIFGKTFSSIKISNSDELAMYLLKKAHVAVVGGSSFGGEKNLRISYATSKIKLKEAFLRIRKSII